MVAETPSTTPSQTVVAVVSPTLTERVSQVVSATPVAIPSETVSDVLAEQVAGLSADEVANLELMWDAKHVGGDPLAGAQSPAPVTRKAHGSSVRSSG